MSMIDLFKMERLNNELDRERRRLEMKKSGRCQEKKVQKGTTRASILEEAVARARPSAQGRVRHLVRQFQEGEIELMECPICLDPFDEIRAAITPCGHPFCSECILNILDGGSQSREASGHCPQVRSRIFGFTLQIHILSYSKLSRFVVPNGCQEIRVGVFGRGARCG